MAFFCCGSPCRWSHCSPLPRADAREAGTCELDPCTANNGPCVLCGCCWRHSRLSLVVCGKSLCLLAPLIMACCACLCACQLQPPYALKCTRVSSGLIMVPTRPPPFFPCPFPTGGCCKGEVLWHHQGPHALHRGMRQYPSGYHLHPWGYVSCWHTVGDVAGWVCCAQRALLLSVMAILLCFAKRCAFGSAVIARCILVAKYGTRFLLCGHCYCSASQGYVLL